MDNYKYVKILLFILSIGYLSSCVTLKRCNEKYPPQVITKDSIIYKKGETVYKDTTVYVYLKADTVYQVEQIYVFKDSATGLFKSDTSELKTSLAESYAWVDKGLLQHLLIQNDSIIEYKIDSAIQVTDNKWESYHSEVKTYPVYTIHWYDYAARVIALIFILAVLVLFAIKVIKSYIP